MSEFQDLGIKEVKVHRTTAQKKNDRKQSGRNYISTNRKQVEAKHQQLPNK